MSEKKGAQKIVRRVTWIGRNRCSKYHKDNWPCSRQTRGGEHLSPWDNKHAWNCCTFCTPCDHAIFWHEIGCVVRRSCTSKWPRKWFNAANEERRIKKWSMVKPEKAAPVTSTTWGLLAEWRWTLGNERHRYAIAWPDKLGTEPMAVDGISCGHRRGKREESRD